MKRICALSLALLLTVGVTQTAFAQDMGLTGHVTVTGFDADTDYSMAIRQAMEQGGPYAMELGALYEGMRNLKITTLGLPYATTDYFSVCKTPAEVLAALDGPQPNAYTAADLDLLSRIIYAEAGCTWIPDWVQRMVGSVVLNRVHSTYYPDTIREVVYQPGQYAPTWDGSLSKTPDARTVSNARYLLENGSICPENVIGQNSIVTGSGVYTSYFDPILRTTVYFCYL